MLRHRPSLSVGVLVGFHMAARRCSGTAAQACSRPWDLRLFRGRGEAPDFVAGERLPLDTHGGRLGEAYPHGMNGIAEGVRQVRGTSGNQVPGARVLVTAGTGVPTPGLVLAADG